MKLPPLSGIQRVRYVRRECVGELLLNARRQTLMALSQETETDAT